MKYEDMPKKIVKFCKKCQKDTEQRIVNDKRPNRSLYYQCSICSRENDIRSRKNNWCKYLATKANSRKKPGSEHITGDIIKSLYDAQKGKCALSGITLDIYSKVTNPSLDRIDSNKGYFVGNLQLVAWIVNRAKGNLTDEAFIEMCYNVALNN